jgi:hypothetical protein
MAGAVGATYLNPIQMAPVPSTQSPTGYLSPGAAQALATGDYDLVYNAEGQPTIGPTPSYAGGAVGTFAGSALNAETPSLSGLYSAAGLTGAPGTSTSGTTVPGTATVGGAGTAGIGTSATGQITPDATIPGVAPIDMTAANNANLAQAQDTAGQTAASEISSMNGLLGAAGMLGGGAAAAGTQNIVENAAGQVGAASRQNAVTTAQMNEQTALANQQSAVTQRGQDIAAQQAQAQIELETAQLNSQRQLALLQSALGVAATQGGGVSAPGNLY